MPSHRLETNPNEIASTARAAHCSSRLLRAVLLFALAAIVPANGFAAAPSATIETCFAPESDCAVVAVRAIDHAQR
jgi:hypothetical protein